MKAALSTRFIFAALAIFLARLLAAQELARAGYSGISGYQVPLWLAVDLGLFKKYGLNLEPILFRGGAESTHALTGGEIQFDVVAPQPHIAANLSGADIIIIGTYFNKHTYSVVARPGIRSPQELRGKKVGVLSVVGLNQIVVATALKHWGMDEKSVTLVRSGGSRIASRPYRTASSMPRCSPERLSTGPKVPVASIARFRRLGGFIPDGHLMTTKRFQLSKRNLVKGFLQGISEGIYVFKNDPALGRGVCPNGCARRTRPCLKALTKATRREFPIRRTASFREFRSSSTI